MSVFPIELSPLRDRPEDVEPLCNEFIRRLKSDQAVDLYLSDGAVRRLESYAWPGNVRELANLVERLAVIRPGGLVDVADLPWPIGDLEPEPQPEVEVVSDSLSAGRISLPEQGIDLKAYLSRIERDMIEDALAESKGVVQAAAEILGIGRTTLVEKIRRYELKKPA